MQISCEINCLEKKKIRLRNLFSTFINCVDHFEIKSIEKKKLNFHLLFSYFCPNFIDSVKNRMFHYRCKL